MLVLEFFHHRLRFDYIKCVFPNLTLSELVCTCVVFACHVDYDQTKQRVLSDRECTLSYSFQLFPKRQILDSFKLKEFADDNFNFDKNGKKFSKRVENTMGKGEIARYEQFLFFLQCFQKTRNADT